ncbi:Retrovirus-related Pol polyprotein from transposon TNT 1-94 [Vitis vinifera]|uniref:Retrovirus-related Pol polyprotein from transposon TNT 1-94 n=1 Tax=Vitis vinifera TaxID=29760 RepID=A0A438I2C9_VITVI|nr:Retrovirus-related Pol polyprotein from transposon TNT 1-94 [Vitis vinifera]
MELKSWIFCRYGSPIVIIHPKTSSNIDKSTFKCTQYNKIDPTNLDIPQFQSNDSWYDQENNEEPKDSKKTSIATVAEIKTEANVAEKAFALVAATDHGDRFHPLDLLHKKLFPHPMDIQTRQTIGCGIKRGKLYYLDLQSKDSNKLQQALMADGSEGEKKKMTWLCLMKTKDEVNLLFQKFHKMIETQYNAKVRVLHSDNGGEYQSSDLQKYLEGHGIIHQTTCSNTPQQNGVAERKNRHLLEVVRASLIVAKTPISYWGEAITSAAYLINRGYRCYHPPTRQMYITMDVVFHEDSMYFSSESELQGEYHKEIQTLDYDYHISEENESG